MTFEIHLINNEPLSELEHPFLKIINYNSSRIVIRDGQLRHVYTMEVDEDAYLMLKLKYGNAVWKR